MLETTNFKKAIEKQLNNVKSYNPNSQDKNTSNNSSKSDFKTNKGMSEVSSKTNNLVKDGTFYQDSNAMSKEDAVKSLESSSLFEDNFHMSSYDWNGINMMTNKQRGSVRADIDNDGVLEEVDMAQAIANSYDSELDLYIQEQLAYAVKTFGKSTGKNGFIGQESIEYLKSKGIVATDVEAKGRLEGMVWSFSLVDEEGNVLQDENGNLGSIIFADGLNADGYAELPEVEFASILDQMGYDCISKADFIGNEAEYEKVMAQIEEKINNGEYDAQKSVVDVYGTDTLTTNGTNGKTKDGSSLAGGSEEGDRDNESLDNSIQKLYNSKLEAAIMEYKAANDGAKPTGSDYDSIQNKVVEELSKTYKHEDILAAQLAAKPVNV